MLDCIVIGAGQAGLAVGYYLRKKGLDFVLSLIHISEPTRPY